MFGANYFGQPYPAGFPVVAGTSNVDTGLFESDLQLSGADVSAFLDTALVESDLQLSGADVYTAAFERRVSQVLLQSEYTGATNERRVSEVLLQAEYTGATNERRISEVLLQVEYRIAYPPSADPSTIGPRAQIM